VYLPAIEGHVPDDTVQAMHAFLEFCYIAQHNVHDTNSLTTLDDALWQFHYHCEIFQMSSVCNNFNLPWQHSLALNHYVKLICTFGAPNGHCSSITESKYIKAVKELWQHSNHFEVLSQMLLTDQHLEKLVAAHVDFTDCGMLEGICLSLVSDQDLHICFNYIPNNLSN
ncbi:hypothetical protein F5148DRAFT_984711, partial [Russula earlei]